MKKNINTRHKLLALVTLICLLAPSACKEDFLDAEAYSFYTPSNTLNTPDGLKSLLNRAMLNLRAEYYGDANPLITENIFSEVAIEGTTDKSGPAQDLNLLILPSANLNSTNTNRIGWFWDINYQNIKFANTVISRLDDATFSSDAEKNEVLSLAYFHRAMAYYRLTQQFGDVPYIGQEITSPRLDFVTTSREAILVEMQKNLIFASKNSSNSVSASQAGKAAILHLLTKVNLALGDFDGAIASATALINDGKYKLMTNRFGIDAANQDKNVTWDLHRPLNKNAPSNTESILTTVDRLGFNDIGGVNSGTQSMRNGVPLWWRFINTPDGQNGMNDNPNIEIDQVSVYGRGIGRNRGTSYSCKKIWKNAGTDYRYAKGNWMRMEDLVYNNPSIKDKSAYYGKNLQLFLPNGSPLCTDTIRNWYDWPHYKLFFEDPERTKPEGGHGDWYIFRLAETYLLRAEAYVWKGDVSNAALDINKVRARANAPEIPASQIDISTILDERVRELYYEEPRKTELTRIAFLFAKTGKPAPNGKSYTLANFSQNNYWYDRIMSLTDFYNKGVATVHGDKFTMSPYHVLWPIPAYAINANTQGIINQNIGYPGAENNIAPLTSIPSGE